MSQAARAQPHRPIQEARVALGRQADLFAQAQWALVGRSEDDVQMELRDLALSRAEMYAAQAVLDDPAPSDAEEAAYRAALARHFCAEAIANLHQRLNARPSAFGLRPGRPSRAGLAFVDGALSPKAIVALGEMARRRQGRAPDDCLRPHHAMMRETFRRFADEKVAPRAERIHREDAMIPDEIIQGLRELGCFGLSVPARYGGLLADDAEDSLGMVLVTEELSRGSLGAAGSLITRPEIMARALLEGGTPEQRRRWLPGIAAGDPLVAVAVTEPAVGSDVANVALRATPAARGWRLNGAKTWCTFAGKAGALLVLARTELGPLARPHRGLSLFVLEKPSVDERAFVHESPLGGKLAGRAIATIGYRGMHSFELFFDDYVLPDDALVGGKGGRGQGFYHTMRGFAGGRLQTAARACGLMRAAFERALAYAEERTVFGRPLADYPLTLQKLAGMAAAIHACQRACHAAAHALDGGNQLAPSLAKLFACRAAEWVTREAMQIHGGMGYAEESDASRYFLDARVLSIFEGAEETLALKVVGRSLAAVRSSDD